MKTLKPFIYYAPESVTEAASLLVQHQGQAKIIAGGTDLLVMMKDRIITTDSIIDIKSIPGLNRIDWDETNGLSIGALTRVADVVKSELIKEKYPALQKAAEALGSPQVRNMATIGGNICRSSPSADTIPPLIIYGAQLRLVGTGGERTVPIEGFFTGPSKNLLDNEVLTEIILPPEKRVCGTAFGKISRLSEDLAKVNCAVKMVISGNRCEDIKIAFGAVAATPVRAKNTEQILKGQEISDWVIELAVEKVSEDISPIDDVRSTAEYRYHVSRILVRKLIKEAIAECGVKTDG